MVISNVISDLSVSDFGWNKSVIEKTGCTRDSILCPSPIDFLKKRPMQMITSGASLSKNGER